MMDTNFCPKNDKKEGWNMYQMAVHAQLRGKDRELLIRLACGDTMDMAADACGITRYDVNNRLRSIKKQFKAYTTNQVIHIATKLGHI
jgi:DNA-binding CsgD family transcriptional regulator